MTRDIDSLKQWLDEIAVLIGSESSPDPARFISFLHEPALVPLLIDLIDELEEKEADEVSSQYSACIFAIDICVAQLQSALESGHKQAEKMLDQIMNRLALAICSQSHTLSYWLPVLNAFYDVHVELSPELRDAYLDLASEEDDEPLDEMAHLDAIRNMIEEMSDLSEFDIADNFFAQSHAMPVEFFSDLVVDLCSMEQGKDIALLGLLHPKYEVRQIVVSTLDYLMESITLGSRSLSRLQAIKSWYPPELQERFNHWIRLQRLKGVVFHQAQPIPILKIKASEVDGSGAQGLFIHIREGRRHRICGLLYKEGAGIKDAWITPELSARDVENYYHEAFDEGVTMRDVDESYLQVTSNHFLAITVEQHAMPDLHLLEIQELTGIHFIPQRIDPAGLLTELGIQINPFTPETMLTSFRRSRTWLNQKRFTESWFTENAHIDKLVNRCSSFVKGVKVCNIEEATRLVFEQEMEKQRDKWMFHFLWICLWLKARVRKNEKTWQDSYFIAHAIHEGMALKEIPVMREIARQTVINSIETMTDRRTHLNRE